MISEESKIGEKYQISCEKLKMSSMEMHRNSREQTKTISEENEIGENYQVLHEESKTSNMEMLNSIDCSIEETLNEVNISLISACCPVKEESTKDEHIELKSEEEMV